MRSLWMYLAVILYIMELYYNGISELLKLLAIKT